MQRLVSFLLSITSATALVLTSSLIPSAAAQESSAADQEARHRKCLEANDYQGCMNFDIDNNSQVPLPEQAEDAISMVFGVQHYLGGMSLESPS